MVSRDDMRVSDAEREAAAARLREHFAAGRLTQEEFEDRLTAVFTATTRRDLGRVAADLPNHGSSPIMGIPVAQARPRRPGTGTRRASGAVAAGGVPACCWRSPSWRRSGC